MLFDDLKKANLLAMKNKDTAARAIYSIVINKCMLLNVEKKVKNEVLTDDDVLNIILKTIKELDDEITSFKLAGRDEQVSILIKQQETIKQYLPTLMSKEEIKAEILKLDDKSIPNIMKHFKANFANKCDMKLVNEIARNL